MNNVWITPVTFLLFTGAVALLTYLITRRDERRTNEGYFLAGRSQCCRRPHRPGRRKCS